MKGAKVLAGNNGLSRKVTKLNVMEVPDIINWVESGEFLLTTAYSIKDTLDKLDELIVQLNSKGLAGLGIKTKRYIEEIPVSSLDIAEELGFPLIEIPYDSSYSDILVEALAEIVDSHSKFLYRIDNIQNKLINLMLNGGSLKEIANAIYQVMDGNSIAIIDHMFDNNVILCDDKDRDYIESIVKKESSRRKMLKRNGKDESLCTEDLDLFGEDQVRRINIPIYSGDVRYGCMYIWEDKKTLTPLELTVIEATTPIIALDIYKSLSIFEIESKQKIEFFEDLFSGDENRFNKAVERAPYFQFDIDWSYSVIIVSINGDEKSEKNISSTTNNLQKLKAKILSIIQRISKSKGHNVICASKSNSVIVLFGSSPDKNEKKIKEDINKFSEEILAYSKYEFLKEDIYISIGRNYKDSRDIWKSYKEATRAIQYQKNTSKSKIIYYDDLGVYRILSFKGLQSELDQLYREKLKTLVEYDKERGTELVLTLKKYFELQGNLKEVSDELFIHYNTAVYRMQRIKEVTSIDFNDYDDRLNLQIALKIFEMQDNQLINK